MAAGLLKQPATFDHYSTDAWQYNPVLQGTQ